MSESDGDFWEYSLEAYGKPSVERRMIALQDEHALNVNLLLWCAWSATRFSDMTELALRKAIDLTRSWEREVTVPLRTARRALKEPPRQADSNAAERLRTMAKAAELEAERIEQAMLERLALDALAPASGDGAPRRFRRNLALYASLSGALKQDGFSLSLLDGLAHDMMPDDDSARQPGLPNAR